MQECHYKGHVLWLSGHKINYDQIVLFVLAQQIAILYSHRLHISALHS